MGSLVVCKPSGAVCRHPWSQAVWASAACIGQTTQTDDLRPDDSRQVVWNLGASLPSTRARKSGGGALAHVATCHRGNELGNRGKRDALFACSLLTGFGSPIRLIAEAQR